MKRERSGPTGLRERTRPTWRVWIALLASGIMPFLIAVLLVQPYPRPQKEGVGKGRIALVCMDGATWNILEPMLKKGQLPHFSSLVKNGSYGHLMSKSAFSPPSWTSIATGKGAEKHGVSDFISSGLRKVKYVWKVLSDHNMRVVVVNWLMAPPEIVNGVIYVYEASHYYERAHMWSEFIDREAKNSVELTALPDYKSVEGYKYWGAFDDNAMNIARYLIEKHRPGFVAIGIHGSNPCQHRYWSAREPRYFDITREEVKEKGNVIADYYKKVDAFLGYFLQNGYTVVFVSDHGFQQSHIQAGPRIVPYYALNSDMQHINFLLNRMLEERQLLSFIPLMEGGGMIDFSRSKAYFYNNAQEGISGVKINTNAVKRGERAQLRKRLYRLLKEAHFETMENVFTEVKETAPGGHADLPDVAFTLNPIFKKENIVVVEKWDEPIHIQFQYVIDGTGRHLHTIWVEGEEYDAGKFIDYSRSGVHAKDGVVMMAGENIKKHRHMKDTQLCDIVPTILYLLGFPVARDMDGKVLTDAIERPFFEAHPMTFVDTYESPSKDAQGSHEGAVMDEASKEKLRSLGYTH